MTLGPQSVEASECPPASASQECQTGAGRRQPCDAPAAEAARYSVEEEPEVERIEDPVDEIQARRFQSQAKTCTESGSSSSEVRDDAALEPGPQDQM